MFFASLDLFEAIRTSPRPVIAAVNGAAAGGGNELVVACDLAIAARSAKLRPDRPTGRQRARARRHQPARRSRSGRSGPRRSRCCAAATPPSRRSSWAGSTRSSTTTSWRPRSRAGPTSCSSSARGTWRSPRSARTSGGTPAATTTSAGSACSCRPSAPTTCARARSAFMEKRKPRLPRGLTAATYRDLRLDLPRPQRVDAAGGAARPRRDARRPHVSSTSRSRASRMTYAETLDAAERVGGALLAGGGAPGDRVLIMAPNCVEYLLAWFGSAARRARRGADQHRLPRHVPRAPGAHGRAPPRRVVDPEFAERFLERRAGDAASRTFYVLGGVRSEAIAALRGGGLGGRAVRGAHVRRRPRELPEVAASTSPRSSSPPARPGSPRA